MSIILRYLDTAPLRISSLSTRPISQSQLLLTAQPLLSIMDALFRTFAFRRSPRGLAVSILDIPFLTAALLATVTIIPRTRLPLPPLPPLPPLVALRWASMK